MASNSKSTNIKTVIVAVSFVTILIAITIIIKILGKVPENSPNTVGNTGGNLNNGGYFCEADGVVYFANPYDHGYLYSMNSDQTNLKKLYNSNCSNINIGGDYLYFCMETPEGGTGLGFVIKTAGIYRSTKTGKNIKCLTGDNTLTMNLVGNNLYYQAGTGNGVGLKKLGITDDEPIIIEDEYVLNPACALDGTIYFGGTKDNHYLYAMNTANDTVSALWDGDVWNPVYNESYFYYMDISDKYSLCRYSPYAQTVEILTHDRVDNFNVGYGYVYYTVSVGDEPGLYRMRTDGSDRQLIEKGYITDVNITSTYTYFRHFNTEYPLYCIPTTGGSYPAEFTAASDAASS